MWVAGAFAMAHRMAGILVSDALPAMPLERVSGLTPAANGERPCLSGPILTRIELFDRCAGLRGREARWATAISNISFDREKVMPLLTSIRES